MTKQFECTKKYEDVRGFAYMPSWGAHGIEVWVLKFDAEKFRYEIRKGKEKFPSFNTVVLTFSFDAWCTDRAGLASYLKSYSEEKLTNNNPDDIKLIKNIIVHRIECGRMEDIMLDIKFLRENPDIVKENIKKKFQDAKLPLVDEVIALDAENRRAKQEGDDLRASRNRISKEIGGLMAKGLKEEAGLAAKDLLTKKKPLDIIKPLWYCM